MKKIQFLILALGVYTRLCAQTIGISIVKDSYEISYECADFVVADTTIEYADGNHKFSYLQFKENVYDYLLDEN